MCDEKYWKENPWKLAERERVIHNNCFQNKRKTVFLSLSVIYFYSIVSRPTWELSPYIKYTYRCRLCVVHEFKTNKRKYFENVVRNGIEIKNALMLEGNVWQSRTGPVWLCRMNRRIKIAEWKSIFCVVSSMSLCSLYKYNTNTCSIKNSFSSLHSRVSTSFHRPGS